MSDSLDDTFIQELIIKFGGNGYLAWFGLIEIISKENGTEISGKLSVSPAVLKQKLHISSGKLQEIFRFCSGKGKLFFSFSKENFTFHVPKMQEIKDNYTKDLQATCKQLSHHIEVEEEEEEEEDKKNQQIQNFSPVDNFSPDTKKPTAKEPAPPSPSADSFEKNNGSGKPQSDPPTKSAEPGKKTLLISEQEKENRRRIALKIDFLKRQDLPQFRFVNFFRLTSWLANQGINSDQADQILAKIIQYRDTIADPYPYCQKIAREMFDLAIIQERNQEHKKNKNGDGDFSSAAELFAAFQVPDKKNS